MFSIVDYLISKKNVQSRLNSLKDTNFRVKEFNYEGDEITFLFLPWNCTIKDSIKFNWFNKKGKIIIYEGPNAIVNPNPNIANKLFEKVLYDFKKRSKEIFEKNKKINLVGMSTGMIYVSFIANNYQKYIKKCTLIGIGPKLGENIFNSIATKNIWPQLCEKEGFCCEEKYDSIFKYNIINNCDKIKNLEIYFSKFDMFIPTKNGKKMLSILQKKILN